MKYFTVLDAERFVDIMESITDIQSYVDSTLGNNEFDPEMLLLFSTKDKYKVFADRIYNSFNKAPEFTTTNTINHAGFFQGKSFYILILGNADEI